MQHIKDNSYAKPVLERFGTFRELTRLGFSQGNDFSSFLGIPGAGCNSDDHETDYACGAGGRS